MRTYRTARPARLLAVTGVALAALSLTACGDGMGTKDEGAAHAPVGSASNAPDGTKTGKEAPNADTGTGTSANKASVNGQAGQRSGQQSQGKKDQAAKKQDPFDPANRVVCNGSNTSVTMQSVPRPLNHMLITVKNTGTKVCDLFSYPTVRFDQVQWAPRIIKESQPQAVVTLAPGESGYAGVLLSSADGSGENGATAKKVTISFQNRSGGNGGASASPSLPAKGVYYDSTLAVTYWQTTVEDALRY